MQEDIEYLEKLLAKMSGTECSKNNEMETMRGICINLFQTIMWLKRFQEIKK